MFTGIVVEMGVVKKLTKGAKSAVITVGGKKIFEDLRLGDSIATNGVCLTVSSFTSDSFTADVMNETLSRSNLGALKVGDSVNLEPAMQMNGRFGGHIVSGHIDGIGRIANIKKDDIAIWYTIETTSQIMNYIIEKGSITIDGISLTVAKLRNNQFSVSIIPHTAKETVLGQKSVGATVNLENDIVGKYIEKFVNRSDGVTKELLLSNGFM